MVHRHFQLIIAFAPWTLGFTWQVQYYHGESYVRQQNWGIVFVPWLPPWLLLHNTAEMP